MVRCVIPALLLVAACLRTSWDELAPGARPRDGTVAIVGALSLIPPVERDTGPRQVVVVGAARDRMLGIFTTDLVRPFDRDLWADESAYHSVYLPFEGPFFIEIPRGYWNLYFRGVVVMTRQGSTGVEVPLQISIQPEDQVVYIGHIYAQRVSPQWTQVKEEEQPTRQVAHQLGHGMLAARPWTVRLARPLELRSSPPPSDRLFQPVPLQAPPDAP